MNNKEAIKALRLEGGIEISGNARRVAEFFEGLSKAIMALEYSDSTYRIIKVLESNLSKEYDRGYAQAEHNEYDKVQKCIREIKEWQQDIHDNEYDALKYDFVFDRIYEIIKEEMGCENDSNS